MSIDGATKTAVNEAAAVACVINDDDDAEGREGDEWHEADMLPLYNVKQKETFE